MIIAPSALARARRTAGWLATRQAPAAAGRDGTVGFGATETANPGLLLAGTKSGAWDAEGRKNPSPGGEGGEGKTA
jgi:hypothetical protein